jgi:hypothetical protein
VDFLSHAVSVDRTLKVDVKYTIVIELNSTKITRIYKDSQVVSGLHAFSVKIATVTYIYLNLGKILYLRYLLIGESKDKYLHIVLLAPQNFSHTARTYGCHLDTILGPHYRFLIAIIVCLL